MTTLLHPITRQSCEFVACERGMVAIRCNYVSRQVRWFDLQLMQLCNPAIDIPSLIPQDFDSGLLYTVPMPPGFVLEVEIPIDMLDAINHVGHVEVIEVLSPRSIKKPAPVISLWSEGLRAA